MDKLAEKHLADAKGKASYYRFRDFTIVIPNNDKNFRL